MLFIQAKPKDRNLYLMPDEDIQYMWRSNIKKALQWNKTYFDVVINCNHTKAIDKYSLINVIETNGILNITPDRDSTEIRYCITGKKVGKTKVMVTIVEDGVTKSDSFEFEVKENPIH